MLAAGGALMVGASACGATSTGEPEVAFTVPGKPATTTSTAPPMPSAKDKPCVAPVDVPAAEGKPVVNVPIGPPPTALNKVDLTPGTGTEAKLGDTIKVHYVGIACSTGKQFDSSWDRKEPAEFPLKEGGLIKGWTEGIPGMKVGGRRQLDIPSDLAYGPDGRPPEIAPDEALIFVIDLVETKAGDATTESTTASTPPSTAAAAPTSTTGSTTSSTGSTGSSAAPTGSSAAPTGTSVP